MEDSSQYNEITTSSRFYSTKSKDQNDSIDIENNLFKSSFMTKIDSILKKEDAHYLCQKCRKFPFIEFSKSRKHVKFTCSCYNSKKIFNQRLYIKN